MSKRRRNVGDRQRITIEKNMALDGVISSIRQVDEEEIQGVLESYNLDNYGVTQDYFYPNVEMSNVRVEKRKALSKMPPEYVYKRNIDFKWELYKEHVEMQKKIANLFVVNFKEFRKAGQGLYIYSATKGSGKTMLACILGNEILQREDISVKFITAQDYVALAKEKNEASKELVNSIKNCTLLILDDIGIQTNDKGWTDNILLNLVDCRKVSLLPTIYTSNCEVEELPLEDRAIDRIRERSIVLKMPEINIRKQKADRQNKEFLERMLKGGSRD